MHIPNEIKTRLKEHFDAFVIDGVDRETGQLLEAAELCRIQGVAGIFGHYSGLSYTLDYLQNPHYKKDELWVAPVAALKAIQDFWNYVDQEIESRLKEHCGCRFGPDASK